MNKIPERRGKFKNIDKITIFVRFNLAHRPNIQDKI